jgi:hypothetical protein
LGLGIPQGPIEGIIGARVGPKGHVEIRGEKGWIERQAVAVLRKLLSPYGLVHPLRIVVTKGDEPGPSMSGPLRKGGVQVGSIIFDGAVATLVLGTSCRQIAA